MQPAWERSAIERTLREDVLPFIEREAGTVTIAKSATGMILFEGIGFPGQRLRMEEAVDLTIAAIEQDIADIFLPIDETRPTVIVQDPELKTQGITELVTIGESDFRGSPINRKHNIALGLYRFNGHFIPQGTTFSFNEVLGPVNEKTGYRKELTIKGDRTLPDYGGGLCQISTTAYRGVWEYGFPIAQRRNHSYSVRYYAPYGTDATIYPPDTDIKFVNDSPGALLIQTAKIDDNAYFLYYGTRDDRSTELIGPYVWGTEQPPPPRTEYTTELAPGETKKIGEAVPGLKAAWFRIVTTGDEEVIEPYYSYYEARPLFHQIGIDPMAPPPEMAIDDAELSSSSPSSASAVRTSAKARFPVVKPRNTRRQ